MDPNNLKGLVESYKQVHAGQHELDEAYTVTNADKKANTKAYQNYKAGMKGKDGKPLYKAADHMKEGVRDTDPEKGTAERKARLEKKRGMKLDDHPQYKKNDGNLANNYPPYDKVTRGDVIAGATGKDQMGGKRKVKEEVEEENIDEGLRDAVKGLLGRGKKKEEPKKPESRGEQLRKKYNVGPERSDTSAKRQILDRTRAKAERDEKEYGGSRYTKSVADKSKAAHDRYLKGGYSKYGADDRRGSGNKARRRAEALKKEELEATGLFTAEEIERILDIMCE